MPPLNAKHPTVKLSESILPLCSDARAGQGCVVHRRCQGWILDRGTLRDSLRAPRAGCKPQLSGPGPFTLFVTMTADTSFGIIGIVIVLLAGLGLMIPVKAKQSMID